MTLFLKKIYLKTNYKHFLIYIIVLLSIFLNAQDSNPYPKDIKKIKERGKIIVTQFSGKRHGFFMYDGVLNKHKFKENGLDADKIIPKLIAHNYIDKNLVIFDNFKSIENNFKKDFPNLKDKDFKNIENILKESFTFKKFPAYIYENKRLVGHDIEIAYKIAERLGVELEIVKKAKGFTNACIEVGRGEADLAISKMTITTKRAQYVRYTDAYVNLRLGVLINRLGEIKLNKGDDPINICNNENVFMAVESGSAWMHIMPDIFPKAKIKEYPNLMAAVNAVKKGEVLATLNDEWNIGTVLRLNPEISLMVRLAFLKDRQTQLAIATNPNDSNLCSLVNIILKKDNLKITPQDLMEKFFPKGAAMLSSAIEKAGTQTKKSQTNLSPIIFISLFIIFILIIWFSLAHYSPKKKDK